MPPRRLLLASVLALLVGCGGRTSDLAAEATDAAVDATPDVGPAVIPAGQRVVFEADYQNWAWGYACGGVYVTADGTLHSFDCSGTATVDGPRRRPGMTEADLLASYGKDTVIGKVPVALLVEKFGLVSSAERGALTMESMCADAGTRTYRAFRFDPATKAYAPITLGADGDLAMRNTEPSGETLVDWLAALAGTGRDSCSPTKGVACVGCASTGCDKSWLTRACDGSCVMPSRCESVSSCAACGSGQACVLDGAGRAHCSSATCSPTTCECAGDSLCAGGKSWCKGSAAGGFRCEQP